MLLALSVPTTNAFAPEGGFQSGPSPGAFYTGGMTYIANNDRAFVTGSHYNQNIKNHDKTKNDMMEGTARDTASSCYLGKIDFQTAADENQVYHSLSDWISYGNAGKIETCSAVAGTQGSDVYVVGSVAEGGLFSDGYPMQGLLSILDKDTLGFIDATLIKSAQDPSKHMIYPLDVIHDEGRRFIYVAALTSTDAKVNDIHGNKEMPNWQSQHMLGSAFDVTVIKIHAPYGQKPNALWVQHYPLDAEVDGSVPEVFVAGMALQKDTNNIQHLLISGSTRGSGEAFGKSEPNSVDEDGFVMQLKLEDGTLIKSDRHKGKVYDYTSALREGTNADDFIRGMCNIHERDEGGGKSNFFYIVGGTKGDMTTNAQGDQNMNDNAGFQFGAQIESDYETAWVREESLMPFLRKVDIDDLKPVWTTQWAAMPKNKNRRHAIPTNAFAVDCFVDNVESAVYVIGSVKKNATMTQGDVEMINQGGDDIWVAKVDEKTGNVFWLTQLGSEGHENAARHGSIAVNKQGNVIIYGNSNGSMYRPRGDGEDPANLDMFLMTLDGKTGAVNDDFYLGGTSSGSVASSINGVPSVVSRPPTATTATKPVATPATPTVSPQKDKETVKPKPVDNNTSQINKATSEKKSNKAGVAFGILFAIAATSVALFFFFNRQMKKKKAEAQKSSIFACLQQFDVEDIDLRRSPPGGWHGTYMNKLAYGHNNADEMAVDSPSRAEGAPLTHSSVANDALFMEDAAKGGYTDDIGEDEVDLRLQENRIV